MKRNLLSMLVNTGKIKNKIANSANNTETFPYQLEVEKKEHLKNLIEKGSVKTIIKMIGEYKAEQTV